MRAEVEITLEPLKNNKGYYDNVLIRDEEGNPCALVSTELFWVPHGVKEKEVHDRLYAGHTLGGSMRLDVEMVTPEK